MIGGEYIYFDQAATSYPKPASVVRAAADALTVFGGNPGHGGHSMAMAAAEKVYEAREEAAGFFAAEPERVIFTASCTEALNIAIKGVMSERGGHLLASAYDHNASLRPTFELMRRGVCETEVFPVYSGEPERTLNALKERIRRDTACVVCTHGSNVTGEMLPIEDIYAVCKKSGAVFILDAAQTSGVVPVTLKNADIICAPGHKGLLGASGTGLLLLREGIRLSTLIEGGTGIYSLEEAMPDETPERFEAGTLNFPGIMSLAAGIREVRKRGLDRIYSEEMAAAGLFYDGLKSVPGARVFGRTPKMGASLPVVSFLLGDLSGEELSERLSDEGFMLRGGYHCAGKIHSLLGTGDTGTTRFSCGPGADARKIGRLLKVLKKIAAEG